MTNMIKYLVVHHTGGIDSDPYFDTSNQSFEVVNEYHRQKWNFKSSLGYYIGYQYYIDKKGKVNQGRSDLEMGAHTIGYNNVSIGICLAGNFDVTMPTPEQIKSLTYLLKEKITHWNLKPSAIIPHRTFANKSCYGKHLGDDWARNLIVETAKLPEPCMAEKVVIEEQKKQISNLQRLVQWLIKLIK